MLTIDSSLCRPGGEQGLDGGGVGKLRVEGGGLDAGGSKCGKDLRGVEFRRKKFVEIEGGGVGGGVMLFPFI